MLILLKFVVFASMLSVSMAVYVCGCSSNIYCAGSLNINGNSWTCSEPCYCSLTQGVPFTVPSSVPLGSTVNYYVYLDSMKQYTLTSSTVLPDYSWNSRLSPISAAASSTATPVPVYFADSSSPTQTIYTVKRACSASDDSNYLAQAAELVSFTYSSAYYFG